MRVNNDEDGAPSNRGRVNDQHHFDRIDGWARFHEWISGPTSPNRGTHNPSPQFPRKCSSVRMFRNTRSGPSADRAIGRPLVRSSIPLRAILGQTTTSEVHIIVLDGLLLLSQEERSPIVHSLGEEERGAEIEESRERAPGDGTGGTTSFVLLEECTDPVSLALPNSSTTTARRRTRAVRRRGKRKKGVSLQFCWSYRGFLFLLLRRESLGTLSVRGTVQQWEACGGAA